jgi:hypothetical protein
MTDTPATVILVAYLSIAVALWYFAARWWYRD